MTDAPPSDAPPPANPPFTAAGEHPIVEHRGLSYSPHLRPVADSTAPATASGEPVSHVQGPQQAPVDPIAAGLDLRDLVPTRHETTVVTLTGEAAGGARPYTYIQHEQAGREVALPDDSSPAETEPPAPSTATS